MDGFGTQNGRIGYSHRYKQYTLTIHVNSFCIGNSMGSPLTMYYLQMEK